MKSISRAEPDPIKCRAAVTSTKWRQTLQCSRKPVARRDGLPVCEQHWKARIFVPWTGAMLIDQVAAVRAVQRTISKLRGAPPKKPRLVE